MSDFRIVVTPEAVDDMLRIQSFYLDRELASSSPDVEVIDRLQAAVERAFGLLAFSPYTCRRADRAVDPRQRELVIPFGHAGLVAAFEIHDTTVFVGGFRHQLEQDFNR